MLAPLTYTRESTKEFSFAITDTTTSDGMEFEVDLPTFYGCSRERRRSVGDGTETPHSHLVVSSCGHGHFGIRCL